MKVLVFAVHPDDETLGCGGTLLKHIYNGDDVYWAIITKGGDDEGQASLIQRVEKAYGFKKTCRLGFPTTKLHSVDFSELLSGVSSVINEIKPQIIYMNNRSDIHTDHQVAAKAIFSGTKTFRYPFVKKIMMYECTSETEAAPQLPENAFLPNVFCDITDFIDKKLEIMKLYDTEINPPPFPRSIEAIKALAVYRGACCYAVYAEAFMLVREIL